MKRGRKLLVLVLIAITLLQRIGELDAGKPGKDAITYVEAIEAFYQGVNPYGKTIESFGNKNFNAGHGFSYFPGFLYLLGSLYHLSFAVGIPYYELWKVCVLLFDVGITLIIFSYVSKHNTIVAILASLLWVYNPYLIARHSTYSLLDPVPIFFCVLALIKLEKDETLAPILLTLSIMFKPFPLIFVPLFFLKTRKRVYFLFSSLIIFVIFSLPFLTSVKNFVTYLNGAILVHSDRILQGRPFLFYLSYFHKIEFIQLIPLKVYVFMSSFFGWLLTAIMHYKFKLRRIMLTASLVGANFLLFTPVLNRTYLLWFMPIFLITPFESVNKNTIRNFLLLNVSYWLFCTWYLLQWKDGFHVWRPW